MATLQISDGETGASARAKINENFADVAALQVAVGRSFDTVAELLADSTLTYVTAPAGTIVEAGGFRYAVAASAVTDQHVITVGGVKLYVQPDAEGWRSFQAFGAVGDGVADDSAKLQAAINAVSFLCGMEGAIYKCGSAVTIPDNRTIDFNGSRIRRGYVGLFVLRSSLSYTTWENAEIHLRNVWIDDDGTTATRGGGLLLAGNRLSLDGYRNTCTAPSNGANGANAIYVTGKDINFRRIWINNSTGGIWADGVHAGYLENFTMTDFNIQTGDDGIALHPSPATFPWSGKDQAAKNIHISGGFVSSHESNGVRIGAWGVATVTGITPKQNVVFQNVYVDVTIGQCGVSAIELVDSRNTSEIAAGAKSTDIFIKARVAEQDSLVRIVSLSGSPDITDAANLAQRNYGRVRIDIDAVSTDTTDGGLIRAGGFDYFEVSGTVRHAAVATVSVTQSVFSSGGTLVLDGLTTSGRTTGSFASFKWIENVCINDPEHLADGTSEFQTYAILIAPEVDMSFYLRGGRIAETARHLNITGTGNLKDFVVEGTQLDGTSAFPISTTFSTTTWASGGQFIYNPAGGFRALVANLPGSAVPVVEGHRAFAPNGRKSGETTLGSGTGQPVYRDGTDWRVFRDDSVVLA